MIAALALLAVGVPPRDSTAMESSVGSPEGIPAIDGTVVTSRLSELLPSGRNLRSIADLWLLDVTDQSPSGGGIATFDPLTLSAHGRSWRQLRFFLNDVEITDPALPGQPLLEVPYGLWDTLGHRSLWTAAPGFSWRVAVRGQTTARVRGAWGGAVGGGTWVPPGLMDREPALRAGATPDRRALGDAREFGASARVTTDGLAVRTGVEHSTHRHRYPTLLDNFGAPIADTARRTTALLGTRLQLGGVPIELFGAWQGIVRSHAGAQYRLPRALTAAQEANAVVAQIAAEFRLAPAARINVRAGMGWREESWRLHGQRPIVSDIEREWTWLHRPRFSEYLQRSRLDLAVTAALGREGSTVVSLRGFVADIASRIEIPGGVVGTTLLRATDPDARSVSLTIFGPTRPTREWLRGLRLAIESTPHWLGIDWRLYAGLDTGGAGTARGSVDLPAAALGLVGVERLADSELFVVARLAPQLLTANVAAFVDPDRPQGTRHVWHDDGDGIPSAAEAGRLLERDGAAAHTVAADLRRPTSAHVVLGWRSPRIGPFRFVVTGVGRLAMDPLTVRLTGPATRSYEPTTVDDPGAPGRPLTVYARIPGTEGSERLVLTNERDPATYFGVTLRLRTAEQTWWFVDLGLSGYVSAGAGAFGLFADRNDVDLGDAGSAGGLATNPNLRVNAAGRLDDDRSFGINLAVGLRPPGLLEGASAGLVLRYRDGEPMTRIVVVDLPQGPTAAMALRRGDPVPRFTFHLTVDLRLRYARTVRGLQLAASVDVYNLLDSGTEIAEYVISGANYRRSLEMMPGRTVRLAFELGW